MTFALDTTPAEQAVLDGRSEALAYLAEALAPFEEETGKAAVASLQIRDGAAHVEIRHGGTLIFHFAGEINRDGSISPGKYDSRGFAAIALEVGAEQIRAAFVRAL